MKKAAILLSSIFLLFSCERVTENTDQLDYLGSLDLGSQSLESNIDAKTDYVKSLMMKYNGIGSQVTMIEKDSVDALILKYTESFDGYDKLLDSLPTYETGGYLKEFSRGRLAMMARKIDWTHQMDSLFFSDIIEESRVKALEMLQEAKNMEAEANSLNASYDSARTEFVLEFQLGSPEDINYYQTNYGKW